jgi:metal-responsive CopG/Arc/MetJ family transcriptional regulator
MENRRDVTVPMPGSLANDIESELEYGNSRAEWIREAARMRLEAERSDE